MSKIKVDRDSVKVVLVLTVIALISALVLSVVYVLVHKSDDELFKEKVSKLYSEAEVDSSVTFDLSAYVDMDSTDIVNVCAFTDGKIGMVASTTKGYKSGLALFVLYNADGTIDAVKSYSTGETPGIGSKVLEQSNLDSAVGKSYTDFTADKLDNKSSYELDAVTGASKTSRGINYILTATSLFFDKEIAND